MTIYPDGGTVPQLSNPMTPHELSAVRVVLGHGGRPLPQSAIAEMVFRTRETIARYEAGTQPIPPLVAITLRRAARDLQSLRADASVMLIRESED